MNSQALGKADMAQSPSPFASPQDASASGTPAGVLVVEDERIVALDIVARIKRLGYAVTGVATSGEAALEACRDNTPSLVLMDIFLEGGMDGIEAARRIREDHDIPVVYITSHDDQLTLRRAAKTAPYGYVIKPVDERWLQSAIEVALYKHATEIDLRRSEERFRRLFERMLNAFVLFEVVRDGRDEVADLRILEVNPAFERLTGFPRGDVEGRRLREVIPGVEPFWIETLGQVAVTRISTRFENYLADLNQYFLVEAYSPSSGQVAAIMEDVTDLRRGEQLLRHRTFHDPLTDLPNRALCLDRLHRAIERAKRRLNYVYALIFLDLDRFKLINDSMGHVAGDKVLCRVAAILKKHVRRLDTVARVGGDEFAVLLEEIASPGDALRVARKIRDSLKEAMTVEGQKIYLSAGMGIVLGPADYERPEELLQNATIAMNHARRSGAGRIKVFDWVMREVAEHDMGVETGLRRSLEDKQFLLYYQPIYSLDDRTLVGFEALVRRRRPDGGIDLPGEFIHIAEETGLIIPLGNMVMAEACAALGQWSKDMPASTKFSISVNLSGKQFSQPDLVKQTVKSLRETGADPTRLRLEITESVLMDNPESALAKLRGLREMGVKIGIDDFGTGYSSLSYLQRFPIDCLKVDRGFVSDMDDHGNRVIVKTVVNLAHSLGLEVVAEGIETPRQEALLKEFGCDFGQGFLFSRPLPHAKASAFLRSPSA
ncbi:MAG: EAL domain-containing protein [Desulfovibrionaceae bacterium]|nr:EAL domain-containing protein [Desulfovibrionaceae bacterium]